MAVNDQDIYLQDSSRSNEEIGIAVNTVLVRNHFDTRDCTGLEGNVAYHV